jgi:hypothetical protein
MSSLRRTIATLASVAVVLAGSASASAAIKITEIEFNPPGPDTGTNAHINEEYIMFTNTGNTTVMLNHWTVRDADGNVFRFGPDDRIPAHTDLMIHTGRGSEALLHKYWGLRRYLWDNRGDRATLRRADGSVADRCSYSGGGSIVTC